MSRTRWVQPGEKGVDFSYTKPPPALLVALGYTFVIVYFTTPPSSMGKVVFDPQPYLDAGLVVIYVFEKSATRMTEGYAAGIADAQAFTQFLESIGCPSECPQLAADDTGTLGTTLAAKQAYWAAWRNVRPNDGIYAGTKFGATVQWGLGSLPNAWSWSNGVSTPTALSRADARQEAINVGYHLIQSTGFYINNVYPVDPNECVKAFVGWGDPSPVPAPPTPSKDEEVTVFLAATDRPGQYLWTPGTAPIPFTDPTQRDLLLKALGIDVNSGVTISGEMFDRLTPAPVTVTVPPIFIPPINVPAPVVNFPNYNVSVTKV